MATVYEYDEPSDTLEVVFVPDVPSIEIRLNDQILVHIDQAARRGVGLTLFGYSVIGQEKEEGPQNFPLTGLNALDPDQLALVLEALTTPPVTEILRLNEYPPSTVQLVPIPELVYFRNPEAE